MSNLRLFDLDNLGTPRDGVPAPGRILSGLSELIEDGKSPVRIKAGDSFVMQPGFTGVWRVIETTRKLWVSRD